MLYYLWLFCYGIVSYLVPSIDFVIIHPPILQLNNSPHKRLRPISQQSAICRSFWATGILLVTPPTICTNGNSTHSNTEGLYATKGLPPNYPCSTVSHQRTLVNKFLGSWHNNPMHVQRPTFVLWVGFSVRWAVELWPNNTPQLGWYCSGQSCEPSCNSDSSEAIEMWPH